MDPYRDSARPASLVSFIRFFACTDNSEIGALALELCKKMQKIAPVRTITMTGVFVGPWYAQMHTTVTPVEGSYISVVACDPSRWTWTQRIPMPEHDAFAAATQGDAVPADTGKVEVASERMSLYTDGVRNVLYAVAPPRGQVELAEARRFEQVIVPNAVHQRWWKEHGQMDTDILGYPMLEALVRRYIVGPDE